MFCIGNVSPEAAGEEIFLNLTTAWSIFHIARGYISGWPICVTGDGTGKISKKQATMIGFGINFIPAKFNTLNYCVGAVENEDIYTRAWEGVQGTFRFYGEVAMLSCGILYMPSLLPGHSISGESPLLCAFRARR